MTIEIKIPNIKNVMAALEKSPVIIGQRVNDAIKKSIFDVQSQTLSRTPFDTGTLRGSVQRGVTFRPLYGSLGKFVQYAYWVHEGHKQTPGRFVPAIGKRLKKKFVKGQPFLQQGVDASQANVKVYFEEAVTKGLQDIAKAGS